MEMQSAMPYAEPMSTICCTRNPMKMMSVMRYAESSSTIFAIQMKPWRTQCKSMGWAQQSGTPSAMPYAELLSTICDSIRSLPTLPMRAAAVQ